MPPQNEAKSVSVDDLPQDVVVLTLWTGDDPNPVQATVTLKSWNEFKTLVDADGINSKLTYSFWNAPSPRGRKVHFFITDLTKVSANYYTGIIPVKG